MSLSEQLIKYLTDVHAIERQALAQMERAPDIAADPRLAEAFERHRAETVEHERRVRERLEANGAEPSRLKDAAGEAGGIGMALFARAQPETPGKLVVHAYSYEHMEVAAYELLRRLAERAGDEHTAATAAEIADEERLMAERLADSFDLALDASLDGADPAEKLPDHLADAHAIERQAAELLERGPDMVEDEQLAQVFRQHEAETQVHLKRLEERLQARGDSPSLLKDAAMRAGALNLGAFFGAQPDTTTKLAGFSFAFEHLEIAAYELLWRLAERAGDAETADAARATLAEERAAAKAIAATWDRPSVALGAAA